MNVYAVTKSRISDSQYEWWADEHNVFVGVYASVTKAIDTVMDLTSKEAIYWINPEWSDAEYERYFSDKSYSRTLTIVTYEKPDYPYWHICTAKYESELFGNMTEHYYVQRIEI